jgi:signal transduction histidine kinase
VSAEVEDIERLRERARAAEARAARLAGASATLRATIESLRTAEDLEALLGRTLKSIADQVGVTAASAWVFDPDLVAHLLWTIEDGRVVRGAESSHANAGKPSAPNRWHEQWLRGMSTPAPDVTPIATHPGLTDEQRAFLLGRGVRALVAVPILVAGQLAGSFTLHLRSETDPVAEDLELIQALANQASLAVHVSRLVHEVQAAAIARDRQRQADERAARLARANAALRDTLASLHTADDLEELLGLTLELLTQHTNARTSAVLVSEPGGVERCVWTIADGQRARGPRAVGDDGASAIEVPIVLGAERVGLFRFGLAAAPSNEDLELLQTLANQAAIAFKLASLGRDARAAAIVEERTRFAREIHDTIAQGLAVIIRQLDRAGDHPEAAKEAIALAAQVARDSLVEARRAIRALRPPALEGHTLDAAVRELVQRSAAVCTSEVRAHVTGRRTPLPSEVEDELFRIANEALTNAIKHAQARTIDVEVAFDDASVRVGVRDDGVGFDPATTPRGVGLSSMRERAQRIGAVVTIATDPGTGTEVLAYWAAVPPTG